MFVREDEEALKAAAKLHSQWGLRFIKAGNYEAAIDVFQSALKDGGEEFKTLLGLCEAYLKTGKYEEANEISKKCTEINPNNYDAKWMRILSLYEIGEFGMSLIEAYRGLSQRRNPFQNGIYRANETIENCIGKNTSDNVFIELLPWIRKLEEQRNSIISKWSTDEDDFQGIIEQTNNIRVNDLEFQKDYRMKKLKNILIKKYSGILSNDVLFIQELLENFGLNSTNKKSNYQLLVFIQEYLMRSTLLIHVARSRKPLYVFNFKKREITTPGFKKAQFNDKQLRKCNIIVEVNSMLMKLHESRITRNYPTFFKYVERAKQKLDSYPNSLFVEKKICLEELYKMVARAYIDPRDVTHIKNPSKRQRYLKHHLGIREAILPRDEDLGWIPSGPSAKSKLEIIRRRLALASEPLELAWLYHEFSKLHIETNSFDLARFYAKKSRESAIKIDNYHWKINANHLLIRIELQQHNKNEAKESAFYCYSDGKNIKLNYLIDFYSEILKFIDKIDIDKMKEFDAITNRQNLILNLMPTEKLKCETNFLFQRMDVVPAKRRLSLVPGCKTIDKIFKLPCKRNTIRVTSPINPIQISKRKLLRQYAPSTKILGWMNFEDYQ